MDNQRYQEMEEEISLSELYAIVKPFILHIILVSIVFALVSLIITKTLIKPTYESSATIIVNNKKEDSNTSISTDEINSAKNLAAVYSIIIKSDAVIEPVIETNNFDITQDQLSKKVSVSPVNNTQVIKISVQDRDPEMARRYTNEIIKVAPEVIVDMVEAGSSKVVSYPKVSLTPVSPNIKMNILVAGMLGFMLSLGFVFTRYLLDKTFKNPDELEKTLGVPVLGVIPSFESVRRSGK